MTPTEMKVYIGTMGIGLLITAVILYYAYGIISYARLKGLDVDN